MASNFHSKALQDCPAYHLATLLGIETQYCGNHVNSAIPKTNFGKVKITFLAQLNFLLLHRVGKLRQEQAFALGLSDAM
jgi:hypothetical protein